MLNSLREWPSREVAGLKGLQRPPFRLHSELLSLGKSPGGESVLAMYFLWLVSSVLSRQPCLHSLVSQEGGVEQYSTEVVRSQTARIAPSGKKSQAS